MTETPIDSSSLLALALSNENSTDQSLLDTLNLTKTDVLCCLPESGEQDILDISLDPTLHGMAYFVIIRARLMSGRFINDGTMMSHIQRFCSNVQSTCLVKLGPDLMRFVKVLVNFATPINQISNVIDSIADLIQNYCQPEVLTKLHPEFMKIALMNRKIERAIELSNVDIMRVEPNNAPIEYQDHLIYHYLAGVVQALNQNYKRAIHLLTIAVSAPGTSTSQIQIEAYKKLILINLLYNSKPPNLPRYINNCFKSTFKSQSNGKLYNDLMGLYDEANCGSQNYTKLVKLVQTNLSVFEKDRNLGLVKLCMDSLSRKTILKHIPLYTSLPISHLTEVLHFTSDDKTIELLQSMINNGELLGSIDLTNQIIKFNEQQTEIDLNLGFKLEELINKSKKLEKEMKMIQTKIEIEPEFLKKGIKELKDSEKPDNGILGVNSSSNNNNSNSDKTIIIHNKNINRFQNHSILQQNQLDEDLGIGSEVGWEENDTFN
ncbi:hypothetical protein CROQUDRAFT_91636 [Cronartium quercuum f. sp. fusiforme G11]|uniref:COP9 signalosome complex subunit 3 n=1 Tax=Cronartium quercuum f. sp. fusiforme G11 TaxID=708437 RepID=A0A9P6TD24_9BASI|nr:hypothetical protein CROQUDRAFT_91636 [Cronartium quercuum f. sp. fusiforme G11]